MKTPREVLLGRHRNSEAKLDEVRRKVIGSLQKSACEFMAGAHGTDPSPRPPPLRRGEGEQLAAGLKGGVGMRSALLIQAVLRKAWMELIWPSRRAWAGMAALWLVVLAANLDIKATSPRAPGARATPSRELVRAAEEQRRLLAELLPTGKQVPIQATRPSARPRSERQVPFKEC
jgi:hypothetical protein